MSQWSLDDIDWQAFDASKVDDKLVSLVKAASMVEHNAYDYARYLREVFDSDADFQQAANEWAREEVQHGIALRKWAELADPAFNFDASFRDFITGYHLPANVTASVRGSRCGELIARCVVEIGTSSYYTAMKDYTSEPVLQQLAARIAADEFRHYKLFYTHLQRYLDMEKIGMLHRLKIVLGRIAESEDDELAYAFYASHKQSEQEPYNRKLYYNRYVACASVLYRRDHIDRMISMAFKTIGMQPYALINHAVGHIAWHALKLRSAFAQWFKQQPAY